MSSKKSASKNKTASSPAKKASAAQKMTPAKNAKKKLSRADRLKSALAGDDMAILLGPQSDLLYSKPSYCIGTRSIALDRALGCGGYPAGRLVEIYGPESSGKTTLADLAIAECQNMGGLAILIDSEHARDLEYMRTLGVDVDSLIICQAHTIEEVFDKMNYWSLQGREVVGPGLPVLIVWDSIAGTPTNEEAAAKTAADKFRASAAKVIKFGMRTSIQNIAKTQTCVIATNQVYGKMGVSYGNDKTTYGGDGVKYHASIRLDLLATGRILPRGAQSEDKVDPVGQIINVWVAKNKVGPPHKRCRLGLIYDDAYGRGIDNGWSIWHDSAGPKVKPQNGAPIVQSGSWYAIADHVEGDYRAWQGAHWGLNETIAANPELYSRLVAAYQAMG